MKTYQLKGLEYFFCAFSKSDVIAVCWLSGIGVTENDVVETDITPNRDAVGRVFKSLQEYENFEVEY